MNLQNFNIFMINFSFIQTIQFLNYSRHKLKISHFMSEHTGLQKFSKTNKKVKVTIKL